MHELIEKIVAVVRREVLPRSETFIRQQLLHGSGYKSVLLGLYSVEPSLDLTGVDHRIASALLPVSARLAQRVAQRFRLEHWLMRHALKRLCPDIVHIHFGVDAVQMWPAFDAIDRPILITLHGYDVNIRTEWWESGAGGSGNVNYHKALLGISKDRRAFFIAVSNHVRERAISLGIPREIVRVSHIGVDPQAFTPSEVRFLDRPLKVLFIGRLVEKKGCDVLIRAMQRLNLEHPLARLVIVGDGPLRSQLATLSKELSVNVDFRGTLNSHEIRAELADTRVFCLPSVTAENGDAEGLPIVLLEAQACGIPVVTSAAGGVEEGIVEGKTGFCFQEADSADLALKLASIINDPDRLQTMSRQCRRFIESQMNLRHCNEALAAVYDERIASVSTP